MDLKLFYHLFKSSLMERFADEDFRIIYNNGGRYYTEQIQTIMKKLIGDELSYHPEYFTIDYTWWKEQIHNSEKKVNFYEWELIIAVEHENDYRDWTYEVEKLDSIKCPLKIVIGYVNKKDNNEVDLIKKQAQLLKKLDSNEEFGIILLDHSLNSNKKIPDISCYLIKEKDEVVLISE